jgi:hypothetical protein
MRNGSIAKSATADQINLLFVSKSKSSPQNNVAISGRKTAARTLIMDSVVVSSRSLEVGHWPPSVFLPILPSDHVFDEMTTHHLDSLKWRQLQVRSRSPIPADMDLEYPNLLLSGLL